MLKIFVGFLIFAALALFVIIKGGSSLDMSGEKRADDAMNAPAEAISDAASDASASK
jgi:hypothetical protein